MTTAPSAAQRDDLGATIGGRRKIADQFLHPAGGFHAEQLCGLRPAVGLVDQRRVSDQAVGRSLLHKECWARQLAGIQRALANSLVQL